MLETVASGRDGPDELLVKSYLTALGAGRFLDALNAFSMDASFRDESGTERHGIREIAAAFTRLERPSRVEIEDLRREGAVLVARVRVTLPEANEQRVYRSVFRIRERRIHFLEIKVCPS